MDRKHQAHTEEIKSPSIYLTGFFKRCTFQEEAAKPVEREVISSEPPDESSAPYKKSDAHGECAPSGILHDGTEQRQSTLTTGKMKPSVIWCWTDYNM